MSLRDLFHIGTKKDNTASVLGKKYELVLSDKHGISENYGFEPPYPATVYRLRALRDFGDVRAGDLGGYVASERNLSQDGNCWVYDNAEIWGNALIYGDAAVRNNARVYEDAQIGGNVQVYLDATVRDIAKFEGHQKLNGGEYISPPLTLKDELWIRWYGLGGWRR